ncbi:MAG: PAS domain-containing protein [Phycisphaerales bacterium]|nr:PAS domain-containing protein [Phycisphaerales bacterium]
MEANNQPNKTPRAIRPDDFEIMEQLPGIVGIARDEDLRMFWCTSAFFRVVESVESAEDMMGKTLHDVLPKSAADEREKTIRKVIETGQAISHYQFSADSRVITTMFPLDEEAFGHRGVMAIIKDAPVDARLGIDRELPVLSTPNLAQLNALTSRELEVLHYVAQGLSTAQIGETLTRSPKTIENHINSIHAKLETHSRSQLVRYACERGIQSFSNDEWLSIINGAKVIHREQAVVSPMTNK